VVEGWYRLFLLVSGLLEVWHIDVFVTLVHWIS